MKFGLFLGNVGRNSGGPEVYETELVRAMVRVAPQHDYHLFCLNRQAPDMVGVSAPNVRFSTLRSPLRPLAMSAELQWAMFRNPTDTMHATFMPPPWSLKSYALTLVCFSMFQHPEFYPLLVRLRVQALTRIGLKSAAFFMCVSKNVRDLFVENFRIPEERTLVTWMGANPAFRPIQENESRPMLERLYGIRDPYFLFSGRWERRKNIMGILRAFAIFKSTTRHPHKLVLTGRRTWAAVEAEKFIVRQGLESYILDVGKSPVSDLPLLYAGAEALVYASLWEGFGMPIVEAMSCGTPVITSNLSSMPEVAGDAALLVNPGSPEEIADAMCRIAENSAIRSDLSRRGLIRAQLFSWENTAKLTLDGYRRLAEAAA